MSVVSIIIPAYNQARYLGEAIRSALAQTHATLEVVVVDDGSTDETAAVARATGDPRVRYVHQQNRGLSGARNTGLLHARGDFVTYLDADDAFLPGKLTTLLAAFEEDPSLGFVAGEAVLIDEWGRPLDEVFDRRLPVDPAELLLGNPLHVGSVLIRRDWQERAGRFDESLRSYEDWDMWLRLARLGCRMRSVPRPVSLYRFHREQMTRLGSQMTTATFAVLDKTFADATLPETWKGRRSEAYSRAHLRAAAQAYTAGNGALAREHMAEAVRLNPALCASDGESVARLAAGWANHAKTTDPMAYLARVYRNLPDELSMMRRRRREELARLALQLAFKAAHRGEAAAARLHVRQAAAWRPGVLLDRGVWALLLGGETARQGTVGQGDSLNQLGDKA